MIEEEFAPWLMCASLSRMLTGTLVTPDKILTQPARAVVRTIIESGIAFTITSGPAPGHEACWPHRVVNLITHRHPL